MTKQHKRQLIIESAQEIISEKGLEDSSIAEIARKAGVVDSLIYHYFKNKEELLFCALNEKIKNESQKLISHLKGIIDPVSKLAKMVWFHLYMNDFNVGDTRIVKNLLIECRSNKNFYKHEGYRTLSEHEGFILTILERGARKHFFRSDLNLLLVKDMIIGLLDEESLSCMASGETKKTLPDFEPIMSLILAMIEKNPGKRSSGTESDKATVILDAAVTLFAEKGYNKTTILEIANLAGVGEGTIYEYFENKRDLLLAVPKERFKKYKDSMEEVFKSNNPLVKLRRLIFYYFWLFIFDRKFLMIFLHDLKFNRQFYTTGSYISFLNYIKILDEILDEGKKEGVFRADVHNRVYKNLFLGTFRMLAMRWFILGKVTPLDIAEEFDQVTSLLCQAATENMDLSKYDLET